VSGKALETVDQESKEDFLQFTSSSFVHRPSCRLVSDEALDQFLANANAWHAGSLECAIGSGFAWNLSLDIDKEDCEVSSHSFDRLLCARVCCCVSAGVVGCRLTPTSTSLFCRRFLFWAFKTLVLARLGWGRTPY
jgi:hypothetical protein